MFAYLKNKKLNSIPQLVNKDTNATAAQSHSRVRSSIFRKPRDMSLEISQALSHAVDIVLLTFFLVWMVRQNERSKVAEMVFSTSQPLPLLPLDDAE